MAPEVKYLGDGSVVLVVGDSDPRTTSLDGGRTVEEVDQVLVARLEVEEVEAAAVLDERPTFNPDTQTWEQREGSAGPSLAEPGTAAPGSGALGAAAEGWQPEPVTGSGVTEQEVVSSRGAAMTGDELDAEIARMQAQRAALSARQGQGTSNVTESNPPTGATPPPGV